MPPSSGARADSGSHWQAKRVSAPATLRLPQAPRGPENTLPAVLEELALTGSDTPSLIIRVLLLPLFRSDFPHRTLTSPYHSHFARRTTIVSSHPTYEALAPLRTLAMSNLLARWAIWWAI